MGLVSLLIGNRNANTAEVRKRSVASLITSYKSSSQAIELALQLYNADRINALSPSGLINGLYFLKATDAMAWQAQQIATGREVVKRLTTRTAGPQTRQIADELLAFLSTIKR